jgi:hypothetical protein
MLASRSDGLVLAGPLGDAADSGDGDVAGFAVLALGRAGQELEGAVRGAAAVFLGCSMWSGPRQAYV